MHFSERILPISKETSFISESSYSSLFALRYNIYFCGFIFCEVLNLLIVLFHFLLTHRFLHYRYFLYGFNVNKIKFYYDVIVSLAGVAVLLAARRGAEDAREKEPNVQYFPKNR